MITTEQLKEKIVDLLNKQAKDYLLDIPSIEDLLDKIFKENNGIIISEDEYCNMKNTISFLTRHNWKFSNKIGDE